MIGLIRVVLISARQSLGISRDAESAGLCRRRPGRPATCTLVATLAFASACTEPPRGGETLAPAPAAAAADRETVAPAAPPADPRPAAAGYTVCLQPLGAHDATLLPPVAV